MTSLTALLILALGLSTDAFAASLARGAAEPHPNLSKAMRRGSVFGISEGLMFFMGWLLGGVSAQLISVVDHWIALVLLSAIGLRMIWNGVTEDGTAEGDVAGSKSSLRGTILTAIGTSIDSATVGVALGLAGTPMHAALIVGLTSFAASAIGYRLGPLLGKWLGGTAEIVGGVVLCGIGLSIFLDHTVLSG